MQANRLWRWGLLGAVALTSFGNVAGCRVSESDIHRWESTQRGPDKLIAVLSHDKYEPELRIEAAMALVRMKPRGGRRVGIPAMVKAVAELTPEMRKIVISGMTPTLVEEMGKAPPFAQAGQPLPPDGSIPFKDAAFALLSYEKAVLVTDEKNKKELLDAIARWCVTDFEHRYDNASQMSGIEQLIRFIGAPAAGMLPNLINKDARKIPELSRLIAENGSQAAKEEASKKLVEVFKHTVSQKWLDELKPTVEEANRAAKLKPTPEQFKAQLAAAQDAQLKRVFSSMQKVGGRAVVDYCLAFAADKNHSDDRRALAVLTAKGNFDQNNPQDVERILTLAGADETPDKVRDQAFRRIGEMPRNKTVMDKLYKLFDNKRWQVRRVAAQYAVKMSNTSHIPEFMNHLPRGKAPGFAMTEPLTYGDWIGDPKMMPEKDNKSARGQLDPFFRDGNVAVKTTALGYFYSHGTERDLKFLSEFEGDRTGIPVCDETMTDCEWTCYVEKKDNPKEKEAKEIGSVGDFVRFCIVPRIKDRQKEAAKKKPDEKKPEGK